MTGAPIADAATALFVPGHRADRFAKAASSGADLVIVDWEDAVPEDMKDQSRRDTLAALTCPDSVFWAAVRINALSEGGARDLDALGNAFTTAGGAHLLAVLVPKAESIADVVTVAAALPGVPIVPLVETAAGLAVAAELAASSAVVRLGFGGIGFWPGRRCHKCRHARSRTVCPRTRIARRRARPPARLSQPRVPQREPHP